jgi:hypothetical protein
VPVLDRPLYDACAAGLEHQVVVGRRDVDTALPDRLAVDGVRGRQRTGAAEDGRQLARRVAPQVQHDEDGGREIGWQVAGDLLQRFDATGRKRR